MKRLSRHTVVVLVVALLSCVGGMALAVVAFGQSGGNPDATVPLGDYTGTTPAATAPLSGYTTTTPTVPTATSTSGSVTTPSKITKKPQSASGDKSPYNGPAPSRVTRPGPTHLAFTGGEPLIIAGAGVALMLAGLTLQARRRRLRAQ